MLVMFGAFLYLMMGLITAWAIDQFQTGRVFTYPSSPPPDTKWTGLQFVLNFWTWPMVGPIGIVVFAYLLMLDWLANHRDSRY